MLLDKSSRCSHDLWVQNRLALCIVKSWNGDAPGSLARDAPIGPSFDGGFNAILAPVRNPFYSINGCEGLGAESHVIAIGVRVVNANEPLIHRAENDWRLAAPA